jgi:hypothetical protein
MIPVIAHQLNQGAKVNNLQDISRDVRAENRYSAQALIYLFPNICRALAEYPPLSGRNGEYGLS